MDIKKIDLPSLEGTEKQVNYALSIRKKEVERISRVIEKCENIEGRDSQEEAFMKAEKLLLSRTEASFWIKMKERGRDIEEEARIRTTFF